MTEEPSLDLDQPKKKIGPKVIVLFLLKLIGTSVFLYWAFSQVEDKAELAENFHLALASPFWLSCGILLAGVTVLASAIRWYILLRAQSIDVRFSYIGKLTLISSLFNVASLGTAAGDAMKMISVMRRYPDKKLIISTTVMVDHLVGFVSGGVIFLVAAWGFGTVLATENFGVRQAFIATTVFQLVGLLFIFAMYLLSADSVLAKFRSKFPRLAHNKFILQTSDCLNSFRSCKKALAISLVPSFALSGSYFFAFYAALRTIGEDVSANIILTVMPIVDVASALPISISGLGVRERTFDYLISELAGIETSSAVSASLIGFLFHVFWGLVGGIYLIFERSAFSKKEA